MPLLTQSAGDRDAAASEQSKSDTDDEVASGQALVTDEMLQEPLWQWRGVRRINGVSPPADSFALFANCNLAEAMGEMEEDLGGSCQLILDRAATGGAAFSVWLARVFR